MTTLDRPGGSPRRLVLLDFDWQDADHLPGLLRVPGVSIRLVAGSSPEDAGVRVAALCGLPRSVELGDLTREIFDVAIVGERSPRREQLERLLRALGTPIQTAADFLRDGDSEERRVARAAEPAEAMPPAVNGSHAAALAADDGLPAGLATPPADEAPACASREVLPGPEDTLGLERVLANCVAETSASAATLHLAAGESLIRLCRSGPEDPLLEALVQLAFRLDSPHVMTREDGAQRGRMWAAWPFHTEQRRAVLAVAAADGVRARRVWETAVQSLCIAWSVAEHGVAPEPVRLTLLAPEAFTHRLRMAVDRYHCEGFRFALYRLTFDAAEEALTQLLRHLPEHLRGTDCVCRPAPQDLLLLCAGSPRAYANVRRRIELLWREAWTQHGGVGAAPAIADERIQLAGAEGAHEFLTVAQDWLTGG